MQLLSLKALIQNIRNILRNNHVTESDQLSDRQIEQWITYYRAMLIKQDIDKDGDVDDQFIQTLTLPLELEKESELDGMGIGICILKTTEPLPKLVDLNYLSPIFKITDLFGNPIQLGSSAKAKFQKYRKYTCGDYIASRSGDYIEVEGKDSDLQAIKVDIVAENPLDIDDGTCPDVNYLDRPYPIPSDKIPALVQLIFSNEIGFMMNSIVDTENDTEDDTVQSLQQLQNARRR